MAGGLNPGGFSVALVKLDGDALHVVAEDFHVLAVDVTASEKAFQFVSFVDADALAVNSHCEPRRPQVLLVSFAELLGLFDDPFDFFFAQVSLNVGLIGELDAVGFGDRFHGLGLVGVGRVSLSR